MSALTNDSNDDQSSVRLPRNVEPLRYRLTLEPDLDAARFRGEVAIEVVVREATSTVVCNAAELDIHSASADAGPSPAGSGDFPVSATSIVLDAAEERATFHFPEPLPAGPATLHLTFSGILNDRLHGFYRSTYTDDTGEKRVIATTQMEATDARRAFPCFDEPDRKAIFEITLVVGDGLEAYSTGAVAEVTADAAGHRRRIRFEPTMKMSTYLVACIVGPLTATAPRDVDGVPLRVVHTPGKEHLTDFALDVGAHALRFFREYFGLPYPAGKLDLVAIPDFAFGAMENLGCVTFRESVLLVDPAQAARVELERVADVVCHEIAHMWFGDLVTMKWWNGIWLNEAFATFMEILAVDAFRPDWQRWVSFGTEREAALAVDGLHATRPVEFAVGRPEEAQGMFDVLTYQKGGSVLRMLEQYLGAEVFRDGIHRYLSAHAHGNTETADLWNALGEASGIPVASIMTTWIDQGGYPLVTVEPDGALSQQPFSYRGAAGGAIGSSWEIPVLTRPLDGPGGRVDRLLLSAQPATPPAPDGTPDHATVLVNAGGAGFYRVAYPPPTLDRLATDIGALEPLERYNLVSDTWAAALAGQGPVEGIVTLAAALGRSLEEDPSVWSVVVGAFGLFDRVITDDDRGAVQDAVRGLFLPVADRLGWDPIPGEGERVPTLRAMVLRTLGTIGADHEVRAEARRRFEAAMGAEAGARSAALHPDIESAVLDVVAAEGDERHYDAMLARYRSPATPQEENRYLYGLASFDEPRLAERTFRLALDEVRTQNAPFVLQALVANRVTGPATWQRVTSEWSTLVERFPANILPRMLEGVRGLCGPGSPAAEVRAFVEDHPLPSGGKTVDQILERLDVNVAFGAREGSRLAAVLRKGVAASPDGAPA
ncbi:MAG: M1 family metallopeptidase [Acidimicrobiales bacterium]